MEGLRKVPVVPETYCTCYMPGTVLSTTFVISFNPHKNPVRGLISVLQRGKNRKVTSPFVWLVYKPCTLAPESVFLNAAAREHGCWLLALLPALPGPRPQTVS